jgi:hypothetical protein
MDVIPSFVVPVIHDPRHPSSPSSLLFVVPIICHPHRLSSPSSLPVICCSPSFVTLLVVVVSTSIPPYEQWLVGRVVVLCGLVLAMVVTGQKRPVATLRAEARSSSTGVCCSVGGQCRSEDART